MQSYSERPEVDELSIGFWLSNAVRDTFRQIADHIFFYVIFLFAPALGVGMLLWEGLGEAQVAWDASALAITIVSADRPYMWMALGGGLVIWFAFAIHASFTAAMANDGTLDAGATLRLSRAVWKRYLLGASVALLIPALLVVAPAAVGIMADRVPLQLAAGLGQLLGLLVVVVLFFITPLWVALAARPKHETENLLIESVRANRFGKVVPRVLLLLLGCYLFHFSVVTFGEILLAATGLISNDPTVELTQDWKLPATVWIGDSLWIAIIRTQFYTLGLLLVSGLWTNGMVRLHGGLEARREVLDI